MPRVLTNLLLAGSFIGLAACANINTIARTTELDTSTSRGKAVHLDVQQRLLIVNATGVYCAEPSPDALAAYAASLGLGASAPGTGAGSAAGGQQSSAASIGLRTQSITLMRDALYRMCEAYANQALGPAQVATLLGRSQDLTAVILAVEQLAGAIAANQVALTGTTTASASASLLSNQSQLDEARANQTDKVNKLAKAEQNLADAKTDRVKKQTAADAATVAHENAVAETPQIPTKIARLESERDVKLADLQRAENDVTAAESIVESQKQQLADANRVVEAIQSTQDAALTAAAAGTTSSSQFSTPVQRNILDKGATEAIAIAVRDMVTEVLRKEYTQDSCMAILTDIRFGAVAANDSRKAGFDSVRDLCIELISQSLAKLVSEATYGKDDSSVRIKAALEADTGLKARLKTWLRGKGFSIGITTFRLGNEYAALRKLAIQELSIP